MTADLDSQTEGREIVALEAAECHALLRLEPIGRLASCAVPGGSPDVVPVNFILDGDAPVFRTHDSDMLAHVVGKQVSLQVDRFDWFHRSGWSVLVQGTGELVLPSAVDLAELDSWSPGPQPRVVRIIPSRVSGRRIELHQRPLDPAGYL